MKSSLVVRMVAILLPAAFALCCRTCSGKATPTKRSTLTFPPDSVLQINAGITLAGRLKRNSAVVVLAFQQNSHLPKEVQPLLSPSLVVSARRFSVFDHLKSVLDNYGFDGGECLGKMICQIGESPLMGGLAEDVITFVLSPSKHRSVQAGSRDVEVLLEAERLGAGGGNCSWAFPGCPRTPLDMISALI